MKLREWNWDAQAFIETDYPDGTVADFVNWMRTTKAWHADPELVHGRLLRMNQKLAEHRQAKIEAAVMTAKNLNTTQKAARAEQNRKNLAKARAALARKVAAQKVAKVLSPDGELPRDL